MPVKLTAPQAASLLPVQGVQLGFAEAYVKKPNRKDVLVIKLVEGSKVAGVFAGAMTCCSGRTTTIRSMAAAATTGSKAATATTS